MLQMTLYDIEKSYNEAKDKKNTDRNSCGLEWC